MEKLNYDTYSQYNWSTIPIRRKSKTPHIAWVPYQSRRATEDETRGWCQQWPDAGVGIITGAVSGLVVLDVDGAEGKMSLKGREMPPTPCVVTAKGHHYYFRYPGQGDCRNFARKLPGLDLRGDGGYVVAPPSVHQSGHTYRWVEMLSPADVDPAECPEWLLRLMGGNPDSLPSSIPLGGRNAAVTRYTGGLLAKMDVSEALPLVHAWNEAHCTPPLLAAEVSTILKSIGKAEERKGVDHRGTEAGLAEITVKTHGENLRYCHLWATWLVWDGKVWNKDTSGRVDQIVKRASLHLIAQAANQKKSAEREATLRIAKRGLSAGGKRAVLDWARSEPGIPVAPDELDADPWLLNCLNGTVDLRNGKMLTHQRGHLQTKTVGVHYDPNAECPIWLAFLDRVMTHNAWLIGYLQRATGYSLTGDTREQCLFFLHGGGSNGKTTFTETLASLLGEYGTQTRVETLMMQRDDKIPNALADLKGARLVTATEVERDRRLAESLVKSLTGGDRIKARFLYSEFFEFRPQFKLWLSGNHKPLIRGVDLAVWRRIKLIPFRVTIPTAERDQALSKKLLKELPGILAWAVRGCMDWQASGMQEPEEVSAATAEYRAESDSFAPFIEDACAVDATSRVTSKDLYAGYEEWCLRNGEKPESKTAIGKRLAELGYTPQKLSGVKWWHGIRLQSK